MKITLALLVASISPVAGQDPDSLAERVQRLERLIDVLRIQLAEQAGGGVVSSTGNQIELSGLILVNAFTNNANAHLDDVPQYVDPPTPEPSLPNAGAAGTIRQSRLRVFTNVEGVLGAAFRGELDVDFFGGHAPSSHGRTIPLPRVRRTRAELDWGTFSLLVGQEAPPISELNPVSFAAMGYPGFSGSGNLWVWVPQVRARVEAGAPISVGLEVAALAPLGGEAQNPEVYTRPDQAERSRRPFLQGRVVASWGDEEVNGEFSAGGHYGWFSTLTDEYLVTKAAAVSLRTFITQYVEIRGEGFVGQGLRSLGGGGIFQTFGSNGVMLRSKGGWGQINFMPTPTFSIGGGAGIDDPNDNDFVPGDFSPSFGRTKNMSYEGHLHWRPFPLVFGIEFWRTETTWGLPLLGKLSNNHINLAAGFEF
jgi:hypothetical protein